MEHQQYDPLNAARETFIDRTSELEFKARYARWKFTADTMDSSLFGQTWDKLPVAAAEALADAIMKAIAEIDEAPISIAMVPGGPVAIEPEYSGTTARRRPPTSLAEKIAKAHARAEAALNKDGMEVLT